MRKTGTIVTRVRPVKKLFIIEANDLSLFLKIVEFVSQEIVGLSNIILLNDEMIFSNNTVNFIDRHDPDIIINYSTRDDNELKQKFKIPTLKLNRDVLPRHLQAPLFIFDNPPLILKYASNNKPFKVFTASLVGNTPQDIAYLLNFGKAANDIKKHLKLSIFKSARISSIDSMEQFLDLVRDHDKNYLYLSVPLAGIGEGSSVWHIDYNPSGFFKDKPTVIFGTQDNLESMVYFWNTRATYPDNITIWFPAEFIDVHQEFLQKFQYYCNFSDFVSTKESFTEKVQIDHAQYYFGTYTSEWETFEFFQNITIIDNKVRLHHPTEQMFSKAGFNVGITLDMRGIDALYLPKSIALGELFVTLPDKQLFPHYFARTNKSRLLTFIDHFAPLESAPLIIDLNIPDTASIFQTLFKERQLEIKATSGTLMANQVIDLVGGFEGLKLLSNPEIFNLVYSLTPKSVEKLVKTLTSKLPDNPEKEVREIVEEIVSPFMTINANIIVDIDRMSSMIGLTRDKKKDIYPMIEELYKKRVLLRGKSFPCPHCGNTLWLPLEIIREENKCYGCNQYITIPIFAGERILGDHFKLNDLVANAVDQGLLPLLLTIFFLYKQGYYGSRFINNQEIFPVNSRNLLAEVDLIFTLGQRLGLAEVKADRGFPIEQIDRLLSIAQIAEADLLLFSTLRPHNTEEVTSLVEYLQVKDLHIPAFVLTREVLFTDAPPNVERLLRINSYTGKFPTGPVLLATSNNE